MLFSSTVFIFLFLPFVLLVYYGLLKRRSFRNYFLLLASLLFYAWGEPWFVFVMIASIVGNWFFGIQVDKNRKNTWHVRRLIIGMLVFNLSIIFVFKYLMFALENTNALFGSQFLIPVIWLPIGISFFTFQAISYVIDVSRYDAQSGKGAKVQKNPLNVGLYIALFPQLIAGPIVRYSTISDQIQERKENFDHFSQGVCRFIFGLAKKVLIANQMALVADHAFATPTPELTISMAWLGALAYTFQIYYDFSGYSDMAIGLGKMFGFHFLENFNYPYISQSVSEFWRRWHISLGTWFRDYVYFPLGGSRVSSKKRLLFNLFVVWFLTGAWHGANWTFITWGLMYFILISLEKLTGFEKKMGLWGHLYTMFFVVIGWVMFRALSIEGAWAYLATMFALSPVHFWDAQSTFWLKEHQYFYLFAILFSFPIVPYMSKKFEKECFVTLVLYPLMMLFLLVTSMSYIIKGAYNPFIYFNF